MLIGTAGHIDHGKTTLVRALTGVDTTHLPEEKKRGITIELGYAYAPLPDDEAGRMLAFIDVPGHEKFVPTMLTGAAGIDFVLLVVAADDGVMPQTREHLAILQILGVARGAVAITKCDRVDAARIAEVEAQVHALLAPTPLAEAPVFAVAASGPRSFRLDALREHLRAAALAEAPRAAAPGVGFRLAVDRHFAVAGAGTVVTGTAHAGSLRVGERLLLARGDGFTREVRVRGLHVSNRAAQQGQAGQRCAVNLAGVEHREVERGDWLCAPTLARPTDRLDLRLSLLADAPRTLGQWSAVTLHHAAGQAQARLALLDGALEAGGLAPGRSALVQAVLDRPVLACWGDRVVIRDAAGRITLGGGRVLDPFPPARHRRRPERLALLAALDQSDPAARLAALLAAAPYGIDAAELAAAHNLDAAEWQAALPAGAALRIDNARGAQLFDPAAWAALGERVLARLAAHHEQFTDEPGVERERLRRMALPQLASPVFLALLESLLAEGRLARAGSAWHLPGHTLELSAAERARADRLLALLAEGRYDPPWTRDLAAATAFPEADTRRLLRQLAARGEVFQVVRDLFYPAPCIAELAGIVADLAAKDEHGRVHAAAFRDLLGIGRKRAIQILEFFDRVGYTRRVGEGSRRAHLIRGEAPVGLY
ncbi:selenocysteine-specific translation elongation factor [Pseudothauera nasutitermitis]|uniref:Selenocysteine-specific elongation factor n=1 Tax=Pseudothauera nasutitermitis TaxID=2565930 RepID=A0A4S4AX27_9RHOO|nr:selenocysteine-specific translation elongation factor [Pseudothauera nasutitermitis]THF64584.1 selenocysteine-specific translation elongation factor [Pseudothauera nasutitermitis]